MAARKKSERTSPRSSASLKQVLAYRHPGAVERFRKEFPVTKRAADEIWLETLRWLWLRGRAKKGQRLFVMESMAVIDEMWHSFVLFTEDYAEFCAAKLGRFVHHLPTSHAEVLHFHAQLKANGDRFVRDFEEESRAQYELIAEELGYETLKRWYVDYAVKYSPAKLLHLRQGSIRQTLRSIESSQRSTA